MKISFQLNQYYIEVFDDHLFSQRPSSSTKYDKVYESEEAKEFQPSSKHAVIVYDGEQQVCSAIVLAAGGATTVSESSAYIQGNNLIMRCSNIIASLTIPRLELNWMTEADLMTCFSIHPYKDDCITHGELSVARIDRSGKVVWQFGGNDILLRLDGKNCFKMNENSISLIDFDGNQYEIDYNGRSLIGSGFGNSPRSLKASDLDTDDFADDKQVQKARAQQKAYDDMLNNCFSMINDRLGTKEFTDDINNRINNASLLHHLDAMVIRSFRSSTANSFLALYLIRYRTSIPTGKAYNTSVDEYLFGYLTMKKAFPKTYIHKESVKEKLLNLFVKRDVDFSNSKKFSNKFEVLTDDKKKLTELLQFKDLDTFAPFTDMEIELNEYECFFRNSRKSVSLEEAEEFADLAKRIVQIFS